MSHWTTALSMPCTRSRPCATRPNRALAFREQHRLLKPGAEAAIVDWCLTDAFDSANREHMDIRARIERHNATPELLTAGEYVEAVQSAGFEVIEAVDQQAEYGHPATPWYMALQGRDMSLSSLARIPAGRALTAGVTGVLERLRMAPAGTSEAARFLNVAADALVEAGELGIFTPSFLVQRAQAGVDGRLESVLGSAISVTGILMAQAPLLPPAPGAEVNETSRRT